MFNLLSRFFRSLLSGSETTNTTPAPPPPPAPLSSPEVFFVDEEGEELIQISPTPPPPPASPKNLFPVAPAAGTVFVYQFMFGEIFCDLLDFRGGFAEIFIPETGVVFVVPRDQVDAIVIRKTLITADQLC